MKALLWKDFRVNFFVLGFGVVCLFFPLLVFSGINVYSQARYGTLLFHWPVMLVDVGSFGLAVQLLTFAMLGGCAVAAERADRSAEFLAYLPPSRATIIASKALLAVSAALFIWLVDVAVAYYLAPLAGAVPEEIIDFRDTIVPVLTATAVLLFGAAWCVSTFAPSHVMATGVGIAAPITVLCTLWAVEYFFNLRAFDLNGWYKSICPTLGIVAFAAGTGYYLRRVEP